MIGYDFYNESTSGGGYQDTYLEYIIPLPNVPAILRNRKLKRISDQRDIFDAVIDNDKRALVRNIKEGHINDKYPSGGFTALHFCAINVTDYSEFNRKGSVFDYFR